MTVASGPHPSSAPALLLDGASAEDVAEMSSADLHRLVQSIQLQALGEQVLAQKAAIKKAYRKIDNLNIAIAEVKRGYEGTFHGDGFDIAPRKNVTRAYESLSPSKRRAARRQALNEVRV